MLTTQKGRNIDSYIENYVLFDLETTGISWRSDDVIEISALRVRSGQVTECFSSLVDPGRPIPWAASRVNHITDDMVAGEPTMEEIANDLIAEPREPFSALVVDISELSASLALDVADAAREKGCNEIAELAYDHVIRRYTGWAYAAHRQRAELGILRLK